MRSRASFRGHPIHPMLIPFPFALLIGGFVADVVALLSDNPDWPVVAWYLFPAGIAMGLLAAVPGLTDYFATVPPDSSGKKRATRHMLVNVGALATFALAWYLRGGPGVQVEPVLLAFEAVGVVLLCMGGWLGGTLVFRNQIGVDHRYANAGKWNEARVGEGDEKWVAVARADELEPNQMKLVHLNGQRIVIARGSEQWAAFSDHCTHRGGSLAGGTMTCDTVMCPWHGSQFDVHTGKVASGPAKAEIRTYPIEVERNEVRIRVGE